MQGFAAFVYVILFGIASAPVVALAIAVLRASQDIIDVAIILLVVAAVLLALSAALATIIRALADWRQAQHPLPSRPSHTINVDKSDRRGIVLVSPGGNQLPVPTEPRALSELLGAGWKVVDQ